MVSLIYILKKKNVLPHLFALHLIIVYLFQIHMYASIESLLINAWTKCKMRPRFFNMHICWQWLGDHNIFLFRYRYIYLDVFFLVLFVDINAPFMKTSADGICSLAFAVSKFVSASVNAINIKWINWLLLVHQEGNE